MASSPATPSTALRRISITPGSRILDVSSIPSLSEDNGIWKRLRDAGFDDESVRRRDKAALIAYIASLEAQIYDLQYNMGLLIMERKDPASKYEEAISSAEKVEVKHLREKAALSSAISEARKQEDNLRKALGVEKECVANLEKALHEMRVECAKAKVAAETKMAEARSMIEDTHRKYSEAEVKLRAAQSLQDDAKRSERAAARKFLEVESREDDLRRKMSSFKSDSDAKEKEILLERQSLAERQRVLNESQNKLLDSQALLNQREIDIASKSEELTKLERELEDKKISIANERRALTDQNSNLELNALSLAEREKAVVEKEILLTKKEQELLVSQGRLASKEHNEIQKSIAEQEIALKCKRDEFEAELLRKQKVVDKDIEKKRRAWELRELDLKQREDFILEKEQDLEVQSRVIIDKGIDLAEKKKNVQEKERHLNKSESEIELTKSLLQKEREEMDKAKIDLENSLMSMEVEKRHILEEKTRVDLMKSETGELVLLENKLKEEIDMIRAQKQQLDEEAEKLMIEKAKFETEWELIDEKREEMRREEERIAGERVLISKFLKDGRDNLNLEKEALHEQCKRDLESLIHDREAFMSESQRERSDWFSKFQKERADFLLDIECRKRELDDCVNKQREEIESQFKEKERIFEEEKERDLLYISALKGDLMKEQQRVTSALKKLETEKLEIKMDREERDKAWAELKNLIDELHMQRMKLKEQRQMLHSDREEIHSQIEQLKDLENVKANHTAMHETCVESTPQVAIKVPLFEPTHQICSTVDKHITESSDSPASSSVSWLKKCASLIFKHPSEEFKQTESYLDSAHEDAKLGSVEKELLRIDEKIRTQQEMLIVAPSNENDTQSGQTGSEDLQVIPDVPSEKTPSSPVNQGDRKRRIDSLSVPGTDSEPQNEAISNKKMRKEDGDAHDVCSKVKTPRDDGQHGISSSTQSEKTQEYAVNNLAKVTTPSNIALESLDVGISLAQACQKGVDQSVVIESETVTSIITKQTVIQALRVTGGDRNIPVEKALCQDEAGNELSKLDEDPSEAKIDKPDSIKQRVGLRGKSKKNV